MKRLIILVMVMLLTATTFAQTKEMTMPETTRDTLYPEIVVDLFTGEYVHFLHPATEISCRIGGNFCTLESYSQYLWEVDEDFLPAGGDLTSEMIGCIFNHPGYLKVTVWDSIGNCGTDSIWFNIKDWTVPIDDFTMEIDSSNHAVFSGTFTLEQTYIGILRSLDTTDWHLIYHSHVSPGYWSWRDDEAYFGLDTIWNYRPRYADSCGNVVYPEMLPGMVMTTQPSPGGGWYLTFRTVLQAKGETTDDYVYPIFTIDQAGVRHELRDEQGEPVILPASANSLMLREHPDKYYQGAVAKLDRKTRDYEIVSYSNKVENPLPDVNNVDEIQISTLSIYPNPSHGEFVVKGKGQMTITNVLGQRVTTKKIDGKETVELPQGMYFVTLNGKTRKIVVE